MLFRTTTVPNFRQLYENAYRAGPLKATESLTKSLDEAVIAPVAGHPDYEHLAIGESEPGTVVVFFMDIRGFTKLAMALDPKESIRILQAALGASIVCIQHYGGHVADLTGDGIMAFFGGRSSTDEEDAFSAVSAASMLMQGIKDVVGQRLMDQGIETVRVGMGLEYGEVYWTRLGLPQANEVKAISGVSFLAGKLSTAKYTQSWQCKIGQNLASWLPNAYKTRSAQYEFEYKGQRYTHGLYLFHWDRFHRENVAMPYALHESFKGRRLPSASTLGSVGAAGIYDLPSGATGTGGPRPLKDRPFFLPDR